MPDVESPAQVPIACTLEAGAAKERVGRWRAILETHLTDRQSTERMLMLRFRRDADTERELSELVVAERDCCAFVDWRLDVDIDDLVVRISGEPDALAALNFVG